MFNKLLQRSNTLLLGAASLATLGVVRGAYQLFYRQQHITVLCDDQLSRTAYNNVTQWCAEHPEVTSNPQQLVTAFAWARSCAVRSINYKQSIVKVYAHVPCAVVNKDLLLLHNGQVVDKKYYTAAAQPLAHITVMPHALGQQDQLRALACSVQKMAPHYFDQFSFVWHDSTRCEITNTKTNVTVIADEHTVAHAQKIITGMELVQKTYPKSCGYVADIRFDKQIILGKQRGDDEISSRC